MVPVVTRVLGLQYVLRSAVSRHYRRVTNRQTDTTQWHRPRYAEHCAGENRRTPKLLIPSQLYVSFTTLCSVYIRPIIHSSNHQNDCLLRLTTLPRLPSQSRRGATPNYSPTTFNTFGFSPSSHSSQQKNCLQRFSRCYPVNIFSSAQWVYVAKNHWSCRNNSTKNHRRSRRGCRLQYTVIRT